MSTSSRAGLGLLLLALGCADERPREAGAVERAPRAATHEAHELAGSWTGTARLDTKAIVLAAQVRSDGSGIATATVSGLTRSEAFTIASWDGVELEVRSADGRLWRTAATLVGDTLRARLPRVGEVVLSRM